MILSMTGFASTERSFQAYGRIVCEVRALNSRYLDVQFKMSDELRTFEGLMRSTILEKIDRGKVECRFVLDNVHSTQTQINWEMVDQIVQMADAIGEKHQHLGTLNVSDVLQLPGVIINQTQVDQTELKEALIEALKATMDSLIDDRAREGQAIRQHLLQRLDSIEEIVAALKKAFPEYVKRHFDKINRRLVEALNHGLDDERFRQELTLYVQKSDIDEELSRLEGHCLEVRRLLAEGAGSVGKRLDFLMQELNREANTMCSKSIALELTQESVALKVLIEQMREQVQNVE